MAAPSGDTVPLQYWDSCLFIGFLTGQEPEKARIVKELLKRARAGALNIAISELVVAEVRPAKNGMTEPERHIVEELLGADHPFMRFYAVTHPIATLAREIAIKHPRLTVPDTVHLATALIAKADAFCTFDGDRDNTRRRSGDLIAYDGQIGDHPYAPLRIKAPALDFGPLFDPTQRRLQPGESASKGVPPGVQ